MTTSGYEQVEDFDRYAVERAQALRHPAMARIAAIEPASDDRLRVSYDARGRRALPEHGPLTESTALEVAGAVGFAIAAAHEAGLHHGAIQDEDVLLRDDGAVALAGFGRVALTALPASGADVRALGAALSRWLPAGASPAARRLADDWGGAPDASNASDLGRTALALASAGPAGAGYERAAPTPVTPPPSTVEAAEPDLDFDDDARKRTRNRFIGVGVLVVLIGFVLLKAVSGHGARVDVPRVVGHNYADAQATLQHAGLRVREVTVASSTVPAGVVISQAVEPGRDIKAGTTVVVTVSTGAADSVPGMGSGDGSG